VAAGGGAADGAAALAAWALVEELEAAAGSEVGDSAGGDVPPHAASKSDEARSCEMKHRDSVFIDPANSSSAEVTTVSHAGHIALTSKEFDRGSQARPPKKA